MAKISRKHILKILWSWTTNFHHFYQVFCRNNIHTCALSMIDSTWSPRAKNCQKVKICMHISLKLFQNVTSTVFRIWQLCKKLDVSRDSSGSTSPSKGWRNLSWELNDGGSARISPVHYLFSAPKSVAFQVKNKKIQFFTITQIDQGDGVLQFIQVSNCFKRDGQNRVKACT